MTENVIEARSVRKGFGRKPVLEDLDLTVRSGEIFALLGRNGAGKTTLIQLLLGLLDAQGGEMSVLGLDPTRDALDIRRRVGYLAEDQTMYGWMTVGEIIRFLAPFYPTWDLALAQEYLRKFDLPVRTKIRHLSKGQNVRLGLLLALAHRPQVLILDDPALGLDPISRKEFNRDLVADLQATDVTVLYSSHLLYEVEPVADTVAILDGGVIVAAKPTDELRETVKRFVLPAEDAEGWLSKLQVLDLRRDGGEIAVTVEDARGAVAALRGANVQHRVVDLNLDEIFEAYVCGRTTDSPETPSDSSQVERVA